MTELIHIVITSKLSRIDGSYSQITLQGLDTHTPRAIAFFDIDKTLAHLDILYKEAIHKLFPGEDREELIHTFLGGFKLGNSFREFDRMHAIYKEGCVRWKDSEVYIRERLQIYKQEIDTPGSEAHTRAASYLESYGKEAALVADAVYATNPEVFSEARIGPLYTLLELYKLNGVLMFGFTANAASFVSKLSMYLGLSEYFFDIATDETMEGGGKEIAIKKLLEVVEHEGLSVPRNQLVFIGDSIRGDVGAGALFCQKNPTYSGYGIVVLQDKQALVEIRHLVNTDVHVHSITQVMPTYGLVVSDVPLNNEGRHSLLARDMPKFLFKL